MGRSSFNMYMINHASLCPGHAFRKNCPQSNRNQGRCDTAIHGMKDDERLLGYWRICFNREQLLRSIVINLNIQCMHAHMQLGLNSCTERALIRSWFDSLPIAYVHHAIIQYAYPCIPLSNFQHSHPAARAMGRLLFWLMHAGAVLEWAACVAGIMGHEWIEIMGSD